jgi:hypothetical protein
MTPGSGDCAAGGGEDGVGEGDTVGSGMQSSYVGGPGFLDRIRDENAQQLRQGALIGARQL